jgi:hypothetical protein
MRRYVHNYVLRASLGALPWGGVAEGRGAAAPCTPEMVERAKAMSAAPSTSAVQNHAPTFMNMDATRMFEARERILKN